MNLITAVIVESAIDHSASEKAIQKQMKLEHFKNMLPTIYQLFEDVDIYVCSNSK